MLCLKYINPDRKIDYSLLKLKDGLILLTSHNTLKPQKKNNKHCIDLVFMQTR